MTNFAECVQWLSFSKSTLASYRAVTDQFRGSTYVAGKYISRKCCGAALCSSATDLLYSNEGLSVSCRVTSHAMAPKSWSRHTLSPRSPVAEGKRISRPTAVRHDSLSR